MTDIYIGLFFTTVYKDLEIGTMYHVFANPSQDSDDGRHSFLNYRHAFAPAEDEIDDIIKRMRALDVFDDLQEMLASDVFMDDIACPLHKAAIRTRHIIGEYKSYKTMENFRPVTDEERQQMVLLERNLDFCILKSRVDRLHTRDGNENNSVKYSTGRTCSRFGDIPAEVYAGAFEEEEANIRAVCDRLSATFIDFPTVDMRNEFSVHWSREGYDDCKFNSFTLADAKKFAMNHYAYDFERYKQLRDSGESSKSAFGIVVTEENASNSFDMDQKAISSTKKSFENEYKLQGKKGIDDQDVKHVYFIKPVSHKLSVAFEPHVVQSQYGTLTVEETLGIDTRLLDVKRFANLDCPPICIPSILRSGSADFHCVYFEGHNTMGQLKNWATIVVVREDERDEYVRRYASPHTYFVSLEDRDPKWALRGVANPKGYSAGDSKYYCWRISNWLHTLWNTPDEKRKCIIMDDQVSPFGHQVPEFPVNEFKAATNKKFSYYNTHVDNDQYRFRASLFDRKRHNMMFGGNARWYVSHATAFMYMDRVCDIMDAAIVCMTSTVSQQDFPLSANPRSNVVWCIDLNKMNAALHTGDEHHIECAIHPAYQAAEDTFMHMIIKNRALRSVNLNTIRWRNPTTGGGTCGRGGIRPFQPIIKYHELSSLLQYKEHIKIRKVSSMPLLTGRKSNRHVTVRSLEPVWGADQIIYQSKFDATLSSKKRKPGKCRGKERLLGLWVKKNNVIYNAQINPNAEKPCWIGDSNIQDSQLSIKNAYAPRHIFTNLAIHLLAKCQKHGVGQGRASADIVQGVTNQPMIPPWHTPQVGDIFSMAWSMKGTKILEWFDGVIENIIRKGIRVKWLLERDTQMLLHSSFAKKNYGITWKYEFKK